MSRVLLIEDNDMNLELIKYLVEAAGHECMTAVDGIQGIELAQSDPPDLILLDIQLPKMDGYAVIKKLRQIEKLKMVPVIAVSSYAMVGDKDMAMTAGFNGYISKPINPMTFVKEVLELGKVS